MSKIKQNNIRSKFVLMFLFITLLAFLSGWFWRIFSQSYFVAILLCILSFLIMIDLLGINQTRIRWITYAGLLFLAFFLVVTHFDHGITSLDGTELARFEQRKLLVNRSFEKVFVNHPMNVIVKVERNFLTNLDFNQFFFAGAPRYRNYALDFAKFPIYFLPFFLFGIFKLGNRSFNENKSFLALTLLLLIVAGFVDPNLGIGNISLFPLIIGIVGFGFWSLVTLVFNKNNL